MERQRTYLAVARSCAVLPYASRGVVEIKGFFKLPSCDCISCMAGTGTGRRTTLAPTATTGRRWLTRPTTRTTSTSMLMATSTPRTTTIATTATRCAAWLGSRRHSVFSAFALPDFPVLDEIGTAVVYLFFDLFFLSLG